MFKRPNCSYLIISGRLFLDKLEETCNRLGAIETHPYGDSCNSWPGHHLYPGHGRLAAGNTCTEANVVSVAVSPENNGPGSTQN